MSSQDLREPMCLVLSAPSGAGKTTVARELMSMLGDVACTISCTTREPRSGESDGVDYFFVTEEEFDRRLDGGEFLEWAPVHDHRYGTLLSEVDRIRDGGSDAMMVIDVQGAESVRAMLSDAVTIFLMPPSRAALEERIRRRDGKAETEAVAESRNRRLRTAAEEIARYVGYDYVVINDDLDEAVREVLSIVVAERCRRSRQTPQADTILKSFSA